MAMRKIALAYVLLSVPAAAEPITVSVEFNRPPYEQSWGTLFKLKSPDGRFVCAAGFVNAVQTRYQTNANDLEFWCRDTSKPLVLSWEKLPKPHPKLSQAYIANYAGTLVDATSYQAWTEDGWKPLGSILPDFENGSTLFWQRFGGGTFLHMKSGICDGRSLSAGGRHLGAFPKDAPPTYVFAAGDRLVAAMNDTIATSTLEDRPDCELIPFATTASNAGRSYGGIAMGEDVVIGGSSREGNAPLYILSKDGAKTVHHDQTTPRIANEHYTYTFFANELLVGLYPSGGVAAISPDGGYRYTETYAPPLEDDWKAPDGMLYREMQAAVVSYGTLFGGLYPWGEVTRFDTYGETSTRDRLVSHPARTGRLPYITESHAIMQHFPKHTEAAWAQRVPTIAVFDGRVCSSIGSMRGAIYDPSRQGFMTADQAADYGSVFCARLEHQLLYSGELPERGTFTFTIGDNLTVALDGRVIASTLSPIDASTLLSDATPTFGTGSYGPGRSLR
ncbi:hypothetical protein [Hyphomicrobium sp.]|uniref:hypothetical protein n=1 Tax=Hyphomicrobium sp. TaxID=82 RepID=UPI003F724502